MDYDEITYEVDKGIATIISVALARQMMWRMLGADHPMEAHKIDSRAMSFIGRSPDAAEGITAFLEKRPARWTMARRVARCPTGTRGGSVKSSSDAVRERPQRDSVNSPP